MGKDIANLFCEKRLIFDLYKCIRAIGVIVWYHPVLSGAGRVSAGHLTARGLKGVLGEAHLSFHFSLK